MKHKIRKHYFQFSFFIKIFILTSILFTIGTVYATDKADIIMVVDESGSMSRFHAWMSDMLVSLDAKLEKRGITERRYGLVGMGSSGNPHGRRVDVGGSYFGNLSEMRTAIGTLVASGGFEEGYGGIHLALSYPFAESAAVNIILVTDEDRDVGVPSLSFNSILNEFKQKNALLNAVINVTYAGSLGSFALGIDAKANAYYADGSGGFKKGTNGRAASSGCGSSIRDYSDLAIATGGAAWDAINFIFKGGLAAVSFTEAFAEVKATEILKQNSVDIRLELNNPNCIQNGSIIDYTASCYNPNSANVSNAVLQIDIPEYTTFLTNSTGGIHDEQNRCVTWQLGTLTATTRVAQAVLSVTVNAPDTIDTITCYSVVTGLFPNAVAKGSNNVSATLTGSLQGFIEPELAAQSKARWRIESVEPPEWHQSGEIVPCLPSGTYRIDYLADDCWQPLQSSQFVTLHHSTCTRFTNTYESPGGIIQAYIKPPEVIPLGACWHITGKTNNYSAGQQVIQTAGVYEISFEPVEKWITPPVITAQVYDCETTVVTGTYLCIYADLIIRGISAIPCHNKYASPNRMNLCVQVQNAGNVPDKGGLLSVWGNMPWEVPVGLSSPLRAEIGTLSSGEIVQVTFTNIVFPYMQQGYNYIRAFIDSNNEVEEMLEYNNQTALRYTVSSWTTNSSIFRTLSTTEAAILAYYESLANDPQQTEKVHKLCQHLLERGIISTIPDYQALSQTDLSIADAWLVYTNTDQGQKITPWVRIKNNGAKSLAHIAMHFWAHHPAELTVNEKPEHESPLIMMPPFSYCDFGLPDLVCPCTPRIATFKALVNADYAITETDTNNNEFSARYLINGPASPFKFEAFSLQNKVVLRWSAPTNCGMKSSMARICNSTSSYPQSPDNGYLCTVTNNTYTHVNTPSDVTQYYTIWLTDDSTNFVAPPEF